MSLRSLTKAVTQAARTQTSASRSMSTMLSNINADRFDDHALKAAVSLEVYDSFHAAVKSGEACDKPTSKALSKALFTWATERGATMKAHWFRYVISVTVYLLQFLFMFLCSFFNYIFEKGASSPRHHPGILKKRILLTDFFFD
tara:strand:+ start:69 stop:500 length:432 start_codon:yes stop_codon:yes gene_type:complete